MYSIPFSFSFVWLVMFVVIYETTTAPSPESAVPVPEPMVYSMQPIPEPSPFVMPQPPSMDSPPSQPAPPLPIPVPTTESLPSPSNTTEPSSVPTSVAPSPPSSSPSPPSSTPSPPSSAPSPPSSTPSPPSSSPSPPDQVHLFNGSCGRDIVESIIDGSVIENLVVNDKIAFILTSELSLYRTHDGGRTWINQASKMDNFFDQSVNYGFYENSIGLIFMEMSSNPFQIYFAAPNGKLWVTSDGGETYQYYPNKEMEIFQILPHPISASKVAGVFMRQGGIEEKICYSSDYWCFILSFSDDSGQTWYFPSLPPVTFSPPTGFVPPAPLSFPPTISWGPAGSEGFSENEFTGMFVQIGDDNSFLTSVVNTNDMFQTQYRNVFQDLNLLWMDYFDFVNSYIFVIGTDTLSVGISTPELENITQSIFPVTRSGSFITAFLIVDHTPGSIFMVLQHDQEQDRMELLFSDTLDGVFSVALEDIAVFESPPTITIDFFKVSSLEGIFIVNQCIDDCNNKQTVISYNKGTLWSSLRTPTESCRNCSLRIYGGDSFTGQFSIQSDAESVGVLLALGTVSDIYSTLPTNASLYISRDAGITWERVLDGAWQFVTTVTFNFVAAVPWDGTTTSLMYSLDQGLNWTTCNFTERQNQTVNQIFSDLVGPSPNVWIVTEWENTTANGFSLFFVDFNVTMRTCEDDDYEEFVPMQSESGCVLGEIISAKRRKRSSICTVELSEQNLTHVTPCNCSRADYFCSFCFVADQTQPGSPCVPLTHSDVCPNLWDPTPPPPNCPFGTNYSGTAAYRKLTGSRCQNELDYLLQPRSVPCPPQPIPNTPVPEQQNDQTSTGSTANTTGYIVLGVLLGSILVFGVAFLIARKLWRRKEEEVVIINPNLSRDTTIHELEL